MKQEDKNLLLKDLCARLPYVVKADCCGTCVNIRYVYPQGRGLNCYIDYFTKTKWESIEVIEPYLRPLSSMTIEEICKIESIIEGGFNYIDGSLTLNTENVITIPICKMSNLLQFMYQRHLDFNNLISMDLALEAPEGMYNLEKK